MVRYLPETNDHQNTASLESGLFLKNNTNKSKTKTKLTKMWQKNDKIKPF